MKQLQPGNFTFWLVVGCLVIALLTAGIATTYSAQITSEPDAQTHPAAVSPQQINCGFGQALRISWHQEATTKVTALFQNPAGQEGKRSTSKYGSGHQVHTFRGMGSGYRYTGVHLDSSQPTSMNNFQCV
jgi:hypothetical protein